MSESKIIVKHNYINVTPEYIDDPASFKYVIELDGADLSYIGDNAFSVYLTTGKSYKIEDYVLSIPNLQTDIGIWNDENNDNINDIDGSNIVQMYENVDYRIQNKMIEFFKDIFEENIIRPGQSFYCKWADIIERSIYTTYGTLVKIADHLRYNHDTVSGKAAINSLLKSLQNSSSITDYQRALNVYYGLPVAPQKCRVMGLYESYEYIVDDIEDNMIRVALKDGERLHPFVQIGSKFLVTKNNVEVLVTGINADRTTGIITLESTPGSDFQKAALAKFDTLNLKLINRYKVLSLNTVTSEVDGNIVIGPYQVKDDLIQSYESKDRINHLINIVNYITQYKQYPEILIYGSINSSTDYDGIYHMTNVENDNDPYDGNLKIYVYNPDNDYEPRYNDYIPSSAASRPFGGNYKYGESPFYKDDVSPDETPGNINMSIGYAHICWPTHKFLLLLLEDGTYYKAYIDAPIDTLYEDGDYLEKYSQICRNVSVINASILPEWNQFNGFQRYNGLNAVSDIVEVSSINPYASFGSYFPSGHKDL